MGRTFGNKNLTDNDKRAIVVGRQNGLTMMTLAGMFGVTEACISQFLKRWKARDATIKSQRTERPRVIDRNDDRNILKTSRTHPRLTAPAIRREVFSNSPSPPSVSTVKRRLNAAGIMGRRAVKKPLIYEKNRVARVNGEFEKTSRLIAGAVSLGLVLGVFKMFLSPLRSMARGLSELRNARLCHAEHSCQPHHGQSILTTHNDGSFVVISQILFSRGSSYV
ncbi:unnamed protein product [Caenorhabditis auriculariae]|uniref:Transposase Tc1-like domain-containing protein n=1 Tax=Caenorhabditis auriculariae TaxID=2777116 RepID=A0A8S1HXK4_9PELO|nr:unnamed protein product [Caenorhabditis auriculariae]